MVVTCDVFVVEARYPFWGWFKGKPGGCPTFWEWPHIHDDIEYLAGVEDWICPRYGAEIPRKHQVPPSNHQKPQEYPY